MKIFSASQFHQWDAFSIEEQGIASIDLMERAAHGCFHWLINHHFCKYPVHIFCGKGNNGGDGLAIARMLIKNNIRASVYILETGNTGTPDFQLNLQRLHEVTAAIHYIQSPANFPAINKNECIVDALFGTGLNKPLDGLAYDLVQFINDQHSVVISIDIPSGLFTNKSSKGCMCITATHTLCFEQYKLAFLLAENNPNTGQTDIIPIGLSTTFEKKEPSPYELSEPEIARSIIQPRNDFSHKGNFGHAAIIAGSYGMMGAALLAAKGCLKTGPGKLTCIIPSTGYSIMQSLVPEAMCKTAGENAITLSTDLTHFSCIGIGPGLGVEKETTEWLSRLLESEKKPVVLDADALNIISGTPGLVSKIPGGTLITPHPKEFDRLFGSVENDFERLELAMEKSAALNIYILLKGHYTAIITPGHKVYFNHTGNAGMAKGGMGDVLTGMITGLLARHYPLPEAAILGVYLHGLAGDLAAEKYTMEAMQATDLLECVPDAWKSLIHIP